MASSRQTPRPGAKGTGRKAAKTGVVKAERTRKVTKRASAVNASGTARGAARKEPYPVAKTRK